MIHNLQNRIAEIVPTMNGWCSVEKAQTLASIIIAIRPSTVIEIGVFAGRSLIPMAMAMKHVGGGMVIGIDSWQKSDAVKNEVKEHADWWATVDFEMIHDHFVRKLKESGAEQFCTAIKSKSDDFPVPDFIDLLHIDGSHTDQAITDAERFAAKVRVGGIVVMDDCSWVGGGVRRACDVLTEELGFQCLFEVLRPGTDDWAVFQRMKI